MRTRKGIVFCALAVLIAIVLYQAHQNALLRARLLKAPQQADRPETANAVQTAQTKPGETAQDVDQQRRAKEHLELLTLRGRVAQLTRALRERTNTASPDTNAVLAHGPDSTDSILFTAATTNRIPPNNALVVGGWQNGQRRAYLLIMPRTNPDPDAPPNERLLVTSRIIQAPESFWADIGWNDAKSDMRRSSLAGVLTSDETQTLLQALKSTAGGEISNESSSKRSDGESIGLGFSTAGDSESGMLMMVSAFPRIGEDGQSIDLALQPETPTPNTPIHPSLTAPR